jgi:hypothetical protein
MTSTWAAAFGVYCLSGGDTYNQNIHDPSLTNCPNPPWNGASIAQTQAVGGYILYRQGVLHLAQGLSVTGAAAAVTWVDSHPSVLTQFGGISDPRWSFDTK